MFYHVMLFGIVQYWFAVSYLVFILLYVIPFCCILLSYVIPCHIVLCYCVLYYILLCCIVLH